MLTEVRDGLPKKSSCSFGFCPNEGGGGPCPIFCPLFTNCIFWVNLGMGREGETPAQIFWHSGTSCPQEYSCHTKVADVYNSCDFPRFFALVIQSQGLLLLLIAVLPLVADSAPTIQSLAPAIAFTPVVCPIAFAHSIIKKVLLSM